MQKLMSQSTTIARNSGKMPRIIISFFMVMLFLDVVPAQASKDKPYRGRLVWGVYHKPTLINPLFTTQSISVSLQSLIFNSLIRWNAQGEIEADLAQRWEISADGLVYTFYLRKGVRFHDGIECTAEDVQFTLAKIIDPQLNSPFRPFFQLVKDFKVIDRYTFQVILSEPSSFFIYKLIREIIPRHLLENSDLKNNPFNTHPVGSGPFRFKAWTKDNQITLEYNPDYYEGRPYLDKIIVQSYADSRQLWAKLMRQEVDLALFIEKEDYEVLKADPAFKAYALSLDSYYAIVYNPDDPVLIDKRVREALAYGLNRKSLIERIAFGYGKECSGPFYPGSLGFNPAVKAIEFNPPKAEELLFKAGWLSLDKGGIRKKEGKELEIRLLVDSRNDIFHKIAMLIRQQLQEIGIKLVVQLYNAESELTKEFLEQNRPSGQLKLLAGIGPDEAGINWYKQGAERTKNLWVYDNPEMERYFALGKIEQDRKKREWIYQEIYRFIYRDQPACFLYFPFHFHVVSSKFEDTEELFTLSMPFYTMRKWFIK